jgi:hypothetical protein
VRVSSSVSAVHIWTALVMFLAWVYAFIDAPLSAAARNRLL